MKKTGPKKGSRYLKAISNVTGLHLTDIRRRGKIEPVFFSLFCFCVLVSILVMDTEFAFIFLEITERTTLIIKFYHLLIFKGH